MSRAGGAVLPHLAGIPAAHQADPNPRVALGVLSQYRAHRMPKGGASEYSQGPAGTNGARTQLNQGATGNHPWDSGGGQDTLGLGSPSCAVFIVPLWLGFAPGL